MLKNYHTHTTWCDGANTPEEMVRIAFLKGFDELGFSAHVDTVKNFDAYVEEINALKEKYAGKLTIKVGLETEGCQGLELKSRLDFIIGSFHFVPAVDGALVPVDHSPELLAEGIKAHFDGSAEKLIRAYFAFERELVKEDFTFLAHPDLVRKFNVKHPYFDEDAEWYRRELELTADAIAESGKPVEINTGAISRGWRDDAYPSDYFRSLLKTRGVKMLLNSDAHFADALDCAFERYLCEI